MKPNREITGEKVGDTDTMCFQEPGSHPSSGGALVDDSMGFIALGAIRVQKDSRSEALNLESCVCVAGPRPGNMFPWSEINTLIQRSWVQVEVIENKLHAGSYSVRVFVTVEDDVRHDCKSNMMESRKLLKHVFSYVEKSRSAWDGTWISVDPFESYLISPEQESLFYLFNTLPSPSPTSRNTTNAYDRRAIEDILNGSVVGLRTSLYPYQRRSAAMMIQRETTPKMSPDPRYPCFHGPTGQSFSYDKVEGIFLRRPSLYKEPRGGILAETMGYGKTLICLAVILASKGHYSQVPDDRIHVPRDTGPKVPSLFEMACAKIINEDVPWKADFHELATKGYHFDRCVQTLRSIHKVYIERPLTRSTRICNGRRGREKRVRLSSTTLVVVPPNLFLQWQQEIEKHTQKGALDVLVIDQTCKAIPDCNELCLYDIVLIAKGRFDREYRHNELNTVMWTSGSEQYQSPLTEIRWLRVILDEGAGFGNTASRTNAMALFDIMYFDRRWVVSGTPSNSLRGVEVGLVANETVSDQKPEQDDLHITLKRRRKIELLNREDLDLVKLKLIMTRFLKVRPWANLPGLDHANWSRYLALFDTLGKRRNGTDLRAILESVIVRHTIDDINVDLLLPPLHNKVTYLEPSFHDKLSINLFNTVLISNAINSERTDRDYMFHPSNRKSLDLVINNMRQSSFHWVGFKKEEIESTVQINKEYMKKSAKNMSSIDHALLLTSNEIVERAIAHPGWLAFSTLHEMGVFVEDFPEEASSAWALGPPSQPLLLGMMGASAAQKYIEEHAEDEYSTEGLPGAGLRALQAARKHAVDADRIATRHRMQIPKVRVYTKESKRPRSPSPSQSSGNERSQRGHRPEHRALPPNSPLQKTNIVGFSSAKLSYLVDQVLLHQSSSKIIIFYDNNDVAFWVAEALELLSVSFRIYASSLSPTVRSRYLSLFNTNPAVRVLLMDLRQASHGLHIAAANRVYIINPIWQPNVEAQAIKRAHRIGQTKPVYVETLVLRGTMEDKMLRRRREMSNVELRRAERSLLDDSRMKDIIKDEEFLPFRPEEESVEGQVARLRVKERLFGRRKVHDETTMTAGVPSSDEPVVEETKEVLATQASRPSTSKRVRIDTESGN